MSDAKPQEEAHVGELFRLDFPRTEKRDIPEPVLVPNDFALYDDGDIVCRDIIPQMENRTEQYADWYAYDIADVIVHTKRTIYDIFAMEYDMDDDGKQDVIAYFISSANSGSLGNITLDIWTETDRETSKNTFRDWIELNPKFKNLEYVRVDILSTKTNGFHDFGITTYAGGEQYQFVYAFDGEMYSKAG
ncbi:MAG: hypothetical protein LBP73_01035 [Clostridiales Family XIII bacterium]|nr:hypothetical protein [Clostridiales Family XIII bacterium]